MLWILAGVGSVVVLVVGIVAILLLTDSGAPAPGGVAQNKQVPVAPAQDGVPPAPPAEGAAPAIANPTPPAVAAVFKPVEVPAGPAPDKLAAETLKKVKKATAYLKVKSANNKEAQGSGFFAIEPGLVFTNAHVLGMLNPASPAPSKVDIVIGSGAKDEVTRQGTILGVDRDHDLGILRVEGALAGLPEPLPVDTATTLIELQKVYVFGFPFGSTLGKDITVSESAVSSLRKDAVGALAQVQVNGGMNPGNSGGPVVDTRGVVVGVAVAIIQGTQINFAVPGDKVRELLRGRVGSLALGETYLNNGRIKLPLALTCLDPLNRVADIKLDVWQGNHGTARPATVQEPAPLPGDGTRQTTALAYQNNKAAAEIELPPLTDGQSFWIQPIITDKTGVKQWGTATAYKLADYPPLERKPALLKIQFEGADRTVKFGNFYKDSMPGPGGKLIVIGVNLEAEGVETPGPNPRGGQMRFFVAKSQFALDVNGKILPADSKLLTMFQGKSISVVTDPLGLLLTRYIPKLSLQNPLSVRTDFEDMAFKLSNPYEMTLFSVPNRELQPKESWNAKVPFFLNSVGKKKEVVDMHVKCTYEGNCSVQGQNQACVSVAGRIRRRRPEPNAAGKVSGKMRFAIDQGYIALVKLKIESDTGDDDSHYIEVSLTRTPGNTTGVTAPPPPPPIVTPTTPTPTTPPPTLAKGAAEGGPSQVAQGGTAQGAQNPPKAGGTPPDVPLGDIDALQGKKMTILFAVKNDATRTQAIDRIKTLVGNNLTASRATTINGRTTLQLLPVNDPRGFVTRLGEVGKITKVDGENVYMTVTLTAAAQPKTDDAKGQAPKLAGDNNQIAGALVVLGSPDVFARMKASEFLAKVGPVPERRADVLTILKKAFNDQNFVVRRNAVQAYGNWMTAKEADGLYPMLENQDLVARKLAIESLGRFPSAASAAAVAKRLTVLSDRGDAVNSLRAMGAVAETAVQEATKSPDVFTRTEACKLLGQIGTAASLPALQMCSTDANGLVRNAARDALTAINGRKN